MARVFVSHSSLDRGLVERTIIKPLEEHGIDTWFSFEDINTASDWEASIRSGLESCPRFLVALTPRSVESQWVKAEVDWAFDNRDSNIIPVLLEKCNWQSLHLLLRTIQILDFVAGGQDSKARLLRLFVRSFYRAIRQVQNKEEELTAAQIDERNRRWDGFAARVSTIPIGDRIAYQKKYNIRALKKVDLSVRELKAELARLKYFTGMVDDELTDDLIEAIESLQRRENLRHVDGVFGELTYAAMYSVAVRRGII